MKKLLGFRLLDSIKELTEIEMLEMQLNSVLYLRKTEEKIKLGKESIVENLKAQATVYGVKFDKYEERVSSIIANYENEIEKIRKEYEFQFVNLQFELRELLTNQKIALVNAKKICDIKKELLEKSNSSQNLIDLIKSYNIKKEEEIKKYNNYNILINSCYSKIKFCINDTYSQIDNIIKKNVENSLVESKENTIIKMINKIVNIFAGKTKFESKIKIVEDNLNSLSLDINEKLENIRNNTIELVAEIQIEKDSLSGKAA